MFLLEPVVGRSVGENAEPIYVTVWYWCGNCYVGRIIVYNFLLKMISNQGRLTFKLVHNEAQMTLFGHKSSNYPYDVFVSKCSTM